MVTFRGSGKMKRVVERFGSLVLSTSMVLSGFAGVVTYNQVGETKAVTAQAAEITDYGLADSSQEGVILHCWNWSYNNIKKYMKDIAAAGYTSIQTSPVQQPKDYYWDGVCYLDVGICDGQGGNDGNWWKSYQPVTFSITDNGYSWLGTKAEFKAMCDEAEKYGVRVIVDVVANHMGNIQGWKIGDEETVMSDITPQVGEFWNPDMLTDSSFWHISTSWTHTSDGRYDVTQGNMGMPDLNTGDPRVQQMVLGLLNECIDCGADGFRFDAAKHIETPADDPAFASDFWDVVLDGARAHYIEVNGYDGIYFYGETLNRIDDSNAEAYYRSKMSITDNSTSDNLRNSVINDQYYGLSNSGYCSYSGGDGTKVVLWPESHDTYMGGGSSYDASDKSIKQTWAIIASRKDSTGLYFARPYYSKDILSGDTDKARQSKTTILENLGGEQTQLGDVGTTTWADKSVVEVNRFRNFFIGQSENLGNDGNTAYNVRGNKGIVIVRGDGPGEVSISGTGMTNGTYYDQVTGEKFTVSNGTVSGNVTGEDSIAVVYNPTVDYGDVNVEEPVKIRLAATTASGETAFSTDTIDITLSAGDGISGTYTTTEGASGTFSSTKTITAGALTETGGTLGVTLTGTTEDGTTKTKSYKFSKVHAVKSYPTLSGAGVVFDNSNYNWSSAYAYVYQEDSAGNVVNNAAWPGEKMTDEGNGYFSYLIPDTFSGTVSVIFNDGGGSQYPRGDGLPMEATSKMLFESEDTELVTLPVSTGLLEATLTPSATTVGLGKTVNLTTAVANADGTVSYSYAVSDGQTISSTSSTATWTPTAVGTYKVAVTVQDGKDLYTDVCSVIVTYDEEDPIVNTSFISQEAVVGSKIVFKGSATGGSGEYQYAYYYRKTEDSSWTTAGTEWGTSIYATAKPGTNTVYEVCIKVRDANNTSNVVKKYLSFAANTSETEFKCYGSVYKTIYKYGRTNYLTASSANASGDVKYKYEYRKASSWTYETIKDYTEDTKVSWDAPQTGSFTLRITAYDGTDYAIRTINIKVKPAS